MIRRIANRIGASYIWGLINFTAGTAIGSAEGVWIAQTLSGLHHHG